MGKRCEGDLAGDRAGHLNLRKGAAGAFDQVPAGSPHDPMHPMAERRRIWKAFELKAHLASILGESGRPVVSPMRAT